MRDVAADLAQRGQVRGDDGGAHGQRLGQRQAVTLGAAGEENGARRGDLGRERGVTGGADLVDGPAHDRVGVEATEHLGVLPTAPAGDVQLRCVRAERRPDVEQQRVVLARLDGAET